MSLQIVFYGDEFYDEKRLFRLLPTLSAFSAEEMGTQILADVDRFVGDVRASDDLSMIVMKCLKASALASD